MADRMELMNQIMGRTSTHECPACNGHAYCAMEDGKSSNLCWCMDVEKTYNPDVDADNCLCRKCLTKKEIK